MNVTTALHGVSLPAAPWDAPAPPRKKPPVPTEGTRARQKRFLEWLAKNPGVTVYQVAKDFALTRGQADHMVKTLEKAGAIRGEILIRGGRKQYYVRAK